VDIYLRARAYRSKAHRNRARATLEAYNADDLASLAKLIETLRGMYLQDEYIPPDPKLTRERRSTKEFWRRLTITTVPADEDDLDPRAWMDDDDPSAFRGDGSIRSRPSIAPLGLAHRARDADDRATVIGD
jgi:hypothetical protein